MEKPFQQNCKGETVFPYRSGLGKLNTVMIDFFNYYSCAIDLKKIKLAKLSYWFYEITRIAVSLI